MLDLNTDGIILFSTRFIRLFSYGWLSVGLILYLLELGYSQFDIGVLFTGTLLGDLCVSFYLTTAADRIGRKNILITGAILKIFAGLTFAFVDNFTMLLIAGILGIISPTGGEIGPFLAIEQAALTESIKSPESISITKIFGIYNLTGYIAQALGALCGGLVIHMCVSAGLVTLSAYRIVVIGYAIFGGLKLIGYTFLSHHIEPLHVRDINAPTNWFSRFGLHRTSSRQVVMKLSALFIIDAFAGGFVMQTIIVYWFHETWKMDADVLGTMMMGVNVIAGISALAATPIVGKIGAINTMVFTHLPSNILLLLIPFMPTKTSAILMLMFRFSISQMDVPARQTYVAMVVEADERSAAGGITNIVRSIGMALSPLLVGYLLQEPSNSLLFASPFIIAGALKSLYDILLYISFKTAAPIGIAYSYEAVARTGQTQPMEGEAESESDDDVEEIVVGRK